MVLGEESCLAATMEVMVQNKKWGEGFGRLDLGGELRRSRREEIYDLRIGLFERILWKSEIVKGAKFRLTTGSNLTKCACGKGVSKVIDFQAKLY